MLEWVQEFFGGEMFCTWAANIWNASVGIVQNLLLVSPNSVSGGIPWSIVSRMYPYFYAIASSLLVLFFVIGYCRENIDLRQPLTMEKTVTMFLRLIISNGVMAGVLTYIPVIFSAGISLAELVTGTAYEPMTVENITEEWSFMGFLVGLFTILIAAACSMILIVTVYMRFVKILLLIPLAPVAMSTFAGGGGLSQSGVAWIKAFLSYVFEIVVIAVALALSNALVQGDLIGSGVDFGSGYTRVGFNMIISMLVTVGSVKGAEEVLRRSLSL